MEHNVEGRPFRPYFRLFGNGLDDEGWKPLWARISKELGISSNPASPPPNDNDSDLSGYDTYPPTPESRAPTPIPEDPWERLEYNRRRFNWDEERYQFERIFRKEALIDGARAQRENEDGDRQAREKREKMESFRYVDPTRFSLEQRHFHDHIDLPKKGWTREEIVAEYEADVALHEWRKKNPPPEGSGGFGKAVTPEEEAAKASWRQEFDNAWVRYGSHTPKLPEHTKDYGVIELWRKGNHTRVSRQRQRETLLSDATGDASSHAEALQRIEDEERRDRDVLERAVKRAAELTEKAEKTRRLPPPRTQRFRVWDELDVPLKSQNNLARKCGFGERPAGHEVPQPPATAPQAGAIGDAPGTEKVSKPRVSPRQAKNVLRQTCSGRVAKAAAKRTEASPPGRGRSLSNHKILEDLDDDTQTVKEHVTKDKRGDHKALEKAKERRWGQQNKQARTHGCNERSTEREAAAQSLATTPQPAKDTSRKTRGGRIINNAPTHAEASPRTAPQRRNRQRKTYKKERASRRLAGKLPEYGMLLGQGEAEPLYKASSRSSRIHAKQRRSGKLSKKPAAMRSVKPRAVLKSGQPRTGRPKRLAKGSKG